MPPGDAASPGLSGEQQLHLNEAPLGALHPEDGLRQLAPLQAQWPEMGRCSLTMPQSSDWQPALNEAFRLGGSSGRTATATLLQLAAAQGHCF